MATEHGEKGTGTNNSNAERKNAIAPRNKSFMFTFMRCTCVPGVLRLVPIRLRAQSSAWQHHIEIKIAERDKREIHFCLLTYFNIANSLRAETESELFALRRFSVIFLECISSRAMSTYDFNMIDAESIAWSDAKLLILTPSLSSTAILFSRDREKKERKN